MTSQLLAHLGENNGSIAREEAQGGREVSGEGAWEGPSRQCEWAWKAGRRRGCEFGSPLYTSKESSAWKNKRLDVFAECMSE